MVPGAPAAESPSVEEPTGPRGPLAPKPDQKGPTPTTPTGVASKDGESAQSQQGEFLTTAQGARLSETDHSQKAGRRGLNRTGSDGDSGYWIPTRVWSARFVA